MWQFQEIFQKEPILFAADLAVDVKRNDYIKVVGRLMSRDVYVNGEEAESVYEISVKEMEKLEDEE